MLSIEVGEHEKQTEEHPHTLSEVSIGQGGIDIAHLIKRHATNRDWHVHPHDSFLNYVFIYWHKLKSHLMMLQPLTLPAHKWLKTMSPSPTCFVVKIVHMTAI